MVNNRRGMTFVEMMMVVAILGVVMLFVPSFLTKASQLFILGRAKLELQREARSVMYIVTRELRQAQSSTLRIDQGTSQPYYSRVRFEKSQGTSTITLSQTGSTLVHTEGIHISTMTQNLSYLSFTFPRSDDMSIISVSLTLQQQIYGGAFKALHMASEKVRVMN